MLKKVLLPLCILLFLAGGVYFVYQMQNNIVTFEDVLAESIDHTNENIERIYIYRTSLSEEAAQNHARIKIEDKKTIHKILEESADMKLKKSKESPDMNYIITITSNSPAEQHDIYFDDHFIGVNQSEYKIKGENQIKKAVESINNEWTSSRRQKKIKDRFFCLRIPVESCGSV